MTSSAASKFSLNKVKVDIPSTKSSHLDVPLQGKQIPKLDPDSVRFNSRSDLHLKASPADGTLAKLKSHPTVSMDVPKVKQISGDSATKAIGGIKPSDVDVPKVKDIALGMPIFRNQLSNQVWKFLLMKEVILNQV